MGLSRLPLRRMKRLSQGGVFDVKGFGCDYAYTVDGGGLGELEYENFNAASAVVEISGLSIHTGAAKESWLILCPSPWNFVGFSPSCSAGTY